ncbi:MAG: GNAT family N-acetyltransferase [Vicinamibacterales bacterium]
MSTTAERPDDATPVVDNHAARRIELTFDGKTAFVAYALAGRRIVFAHTEVPAELQGKGVGSALVRGALDLARQRGLEVVPLCPFVASFIERHPEYLCLVGDNVRGNLAQG